MLNGLRILLAEDNPTNQLVASQMLESLGATVTVAEDGAEALEIVARQPFDVLLIDIEMPRVSGIEVLRTLRAAEGPVADLPMIALTAYVMREHREAIDAAGADGVIAKPILSIEEFGNALLGYMRKRRGNAMAVVAPEPEAADMPVNTAVLDGLAEAIGPVAMAELLERVSGDLESARGRLEQVVAAAEARPLGAAELGELRTVTHILISVAGAVGAAGTERLAREVNAAAHTGQNADMMDQTRMLIGAIARVIAFVRDRPAQVN